MSRQAALAAFRDIDNTAWLIERHGFRPPAAIRNTHLAAHQSPHRVQSGLS